jgi:UDP-2,3-diacylglucosamine hydrolase
MLPLFYSTDITIMAIYFISDLHLSEHEPHLTQLFEHFMAQILQPQDTLYILGDLFEYWIGDDQDSATIQRIKTLLKDLAARQIQWYFLAGNRDFLIGKKFLKQTGGNLLPEKYLLTVGPHKVLLLHGDTLCTLDHNYQAFRKKVQQRWVQKLFSLIPLKKRLNIVSKMRQKSQQQGEYLNDAMMDVVEADVMQEFNHYDADIMIHGHVHRPAIHIYDNQAQKRYRYVLADWNQQGNYLRFDKQGFELRYFDVTN